MPIVISRIKEQKIKRHDPRGLWVDISPEVSGLLELFLNPKETTGKESTNEGYKFNQEDCPVAFVCVQM